MPLPYSRRLPKAGLLTTTAMCFMTAAVAPTFAGEPLNPTTVHEQAITIDSHVDISWAYPNGETDPGINGDMDASLPRLLEGRMDAAFFIVYVPQGPRDTAGYETAQAQALQKFQAIKRMATELYPSHVALAVTADEVEKNAAAGKISALIGIENGFAIGQDLALLTTYRDLGARYITLVHNGNNDICGSAQPDPALGDGMDMLGLSPFGHQVVQKMNQLGIMVDVSHASKPCMMQAVQASNAPVIASHSNVRTLTDHVRNLDDEQLLAIRKNGGVVQVTAVDSFLKKGYAEKAAALDALAAETGVQAMAKEKHVFPKYAARYVSHEQRSAYEFGVAAINVKWPTATVADLVGHIEYIVRKIGIDHVGISSDFDGGGSISGYDTPLGAPAITQELIHRGYSKNDIKKIWGGNLLRVMRQVESAAGK